MASLSWNEDTTCDEFEWWSQCLLCLLLTPWLSSPMTILTVRKCGNHAIIHPIPFCNEAMAKEIHVCYVQP